MTDTDPALKRILWRCRRGTRELDLVLSSFATAHYLELPEPMQAQFQHLLSVQDPVLADWLCYDAEADREYHPIVNLILQHKRTLSFR